MGDQKKQTEELNEQDLAQVSGGMAQRKDRLCGMSPKTSDALHNNVMGNE